MADGDHAKPVIISSYDPGIHGSDLDKTIIRLNDDAAWKDLSTIIIRPAGKAIPTKVVAAWDALIKPPNNRVCSLWAQGVEVGEAYSQIIEMVLVHPELSKWKYVLCMEHDNVPPADGMVRILRTIEAHPEYAAIGGLYFTKGYGGVAQIWGDPHEQPFNFRPQPPDPNGGLKECNGTGMGFTVFRLPMFKDKRLRRPWFKTTASPQEGAFSQDLYFWSDAHQHGFRCAVDCGVRVGHYSVEDDIVW